MGEEKTKYGGDVVMFLLNKIIKNVGLAHGFKTMYMVFMHMDLNHGFKTMHMVYGFKTMCKANIFLRIIQFCVFFLTHIFFGLIIKFLLFYCFVR